MFGSIAVVITLALLVSLLTVKVGKLQYSVIVLSLSGALAATILSGTRGAWLGLIVAVPLAVGLTFLVKEIPRRRIALVIVMGLGLTLIAGLMVNDVIMDRWQTTIHSIDTSKVLTDQRSSIGQRFMMWDAAIKIWYRNPVIGTGLGDFQGDFEKMKASGEVKWADMPIVSSSYAHSIIFEALATTGILGLIGLILATFLLPMVYFARALKVSVTEYDRYASVFGLVFVTAFLIFGLTENWLVHKQLVMTFSLLLAIMASRFDAETG
jgi:O-antigen ligase